MSKRSRGQLALQQMQLHKKKKLMDVIVSESNLDISPGLGGVNGKVIVVVDEAPVTAAAAVAAVHDDTRTVIHGDVETGDVMKITSYSKSRHLSKRAGNGSKSTSRQMIETDHVTNISILDSNAAATTVSVSNSQTTDHSIDSTAEDLSQQSMLKLIDSFKLLDNVVFSHRKRNKKRSWDEIAASYNAIGSSNLTLETLLGILSVWPKAYDLKWVSKSSTRRVNSSSSSSSSSSSGERGFQGVYNLMLDIPAGDNDLSASQQVISISEGQSRSRAITDIGERMIIFRNRIEQRRLQAVGSDRKDLWRDPSVDLLPKQPSPVSTTTPRGPTAPIISRNHHLVIMPFLRSVNAQADPKGGDSDGVAFSTTIEELREKIQQRSIQSSEATELMKIQREDEERVKIAILMPRVCDEIRFMSLRGCRSTMVLSACVEGVVEKLNDSIIHAAHVEAMIYRIAEIVPEYIVATASGIINGVVVPATIRVDNRISYNQIKLKLQQTINNFSLVQL